MKLVKKNDEKYINTNKVYKASSFYGIDVYATDSEEELFFVCGSTDNVIQVVTISAYYGEGGGGTLNVLRPNRYLEDN